MGGACHGYVKPPLASVVAEATAVTAATMAFSYFRARHGDTGDIIYILHTYVLAYNEEVPKHGVREEEYAVRISTQQTCRLAVLAAPIAAIRKQYNTALTFSLSLSLSLSFSFFFARACG